MIRARERDWVFALGGRPSPAYGRVSANEILPRFAEHVVSFILAKTARSTVLLSKAINCSRKYSPMELDATDWKILSLLQSDARISNVDLARQVGLSPSPCLNRVRALEKERLHQPLCDAARCAAGRAQGQRVHPGHAGEADRAGAGNVRARDPRSARRSWSAI